MYENTGEKIKSFARTMATFEIVSCVIIAFVLFILFCSSASSSVTGSLPFIFLGVSLGIGIGGSLLAWLKFLFLAGFGELIEETAKSSAELHEIKELLSNNRCESSESTYNIESQEQE